MKSRFIFILFLAASLLGANTALADQKTVEHYFKKPEFTGFQVSPDGKHLAALAPVNSRMNIIVMDIATRKAQVVTGMTDQDISYYQWANNERLIFGMDKDGSESLGLFAVNIDGSLQRVLAEPLAAQISSGASIIRFTAPLDLLRDDPEHILVINNERRAAHPDVYKMDIYTGHKELVERNPGNVSGWFVDWDGNVIGAGFQDKLEQGFLMKNPATGEWDEVTRTRYDQPSYAPVSLSGDGEHGLVSSNLTTDGKPRDKAAIYRYDYKTRTLGDLVYENDVVDVSNVVQSRKERKAIGVAYMLGKPQVEWIDEAWKQRMSAIDQALPDTINVMSSVDDAESVGILTAYSDIQPPVYYLFDFAKNSLEFLAESEPWIKPAEMAHMQPITFQSRDGLTLHGYLTLPPGSDGKNLPTVVNPHGGPWARDGWGYNPEKQFLAGLGYAVIQVNFRGSTGYGLSFWLASKKQWGQAMQSDVSDALEWAVQQGISDPKRVCIYGGSYGGYATMAGLTFTPDLYKCGVNYVGVTDLPLLFKTAPDSWAAGKEQMADLIGDPDNDEEFLEEWSPSNHADRIKAPVFMAYGLSDPRVNIRHLRVMESALKKNDVPYETMIKKNEGHGYRKQENVYDFYGHMEEFLSQYLKPDAPGAP